ncbi:hypothetical protein [Epilithonimonas lactis]|uniref:Uncharacterized protein n=1 Tax=Epilithonimonas lactis TaxID=421072 RepID=A0A085BLX9_9FLAO|nr:hypothetical protein [Epilithonimonas lactis]KFC23474.1 hypothetical protein IO89_02490 [Epilithonimonas lactis]SEQ14437.1 hypothetical protein SAMN04488097_1461 [Epilithonimonas lactis]
MTQRFLLKQLVLLVMICTMNQIYCQQNYKIFTGPLASVNTDFKPLGKDVLGSPYLTANFVPALVGDSQEVVQIRYDAYSDKIEVLNDGKVYEVPKSEELSRFKLTTTGVIIVYLKDYNGYFFRLVEGKNQLLKKETIKLQVTKTSVEPNSTIKEGYSKFERISPTYFIVSDQKIMKAPKNNKELLSYFPEKKSELEDFMKANKINVKQEESLVKMVTFLNK